MFYQKGYILLILLSAGLVSGCTFENNKNSSYPDKVIEYGLQAQYDRAKFEAYRLSTGTSCDCRATFGKTNVSDLPDTVALIESAVQMLSLERREDTVFYALDFFYEDEAGGFHQTQTIQTADWHCPDFLILGFIKNTTTPVISYVDDTAVITYDETTIALRDSLFKGCFSLQEKVHPWLQSYLKNE